MEEGVVYDGRARVETSAGGVVIRRIGEVRHALVIRDPYHRWGLPKGHAEGDETLPETALREVREETGLLDLMIGPELVTIDWRFTAEGELIHKHTTFFLMYSESGEPVPAVQEGISACEWVPLAEAHDRISYENASEVVKLAQRMLDNGPEASPRGPVPLRPARRAMEGEAGEAAH